MGFSGGSAVKNPPASAGDAGLIPGSGRFPWRRKWQTAPVFLSGESRRQRSLVSYSPGVHKRVGHNLVTKQTKKQQSMNLSWQTFMKTNSLGSVFLPPAWYWSLRQCIFLAFHSGVFFDLFILAFRQRERFGVLAF